VGKSIKSGNINQPWEGSSLVPKLVLTRSTIARRNTSKHWLSLHVFTRRRLQTNRLNRHVLSLAGV